jgi:DNA-binding beta-propeller fold protein YncE
MKRRTFVTVFIVATFLVSTWPSCKKDPLIFDLEASGYPRDVGVLILSNCAVPGCHTEASKNAAAGLDLSSWEAMMSGDRNGAVCIPYSHEYSTLFMFTNPYTELGPTAEPTMPIGEPDLSREQVQMIRDWINRGAPNANGEVKFADNPQRRKYYVTNQGCDVVTVVDAETNLQMRYVSVGASSSIEAPHYIKISPDGLYWYVSFISGGYLEKHRTSDDALVGRILLGPNASAAYGSWNTFTITADSRYAYVVDWAFDGRMARVNLETMQWEQTYQGSGLLIQPHGSAMSPDGNFLYVTCNQGNYVYKIDVTDPWSPVIDKVIIDGTGVAINAPSENGHEIMFSPDATKYFVTSQRSNLIRIMSATNDSLLASIPVGTYPQEMDVSESMPYLYVSCMEDTVTYPGQRGSIAVIDWQTHQLVTTINTGWQPHGVAVNDDMGIVFITNRNVVPGGPAPHHSGACAGRNGYFTLIDMNTNTLVPGSKTEVAVDPYSAVYR